MKKLLLIAGLLLAAMSGAGAASTPAQAPDFAGISQWINSPPLTLAALRGKVVLIDFWAYSCINCLRAMPHVEHLYEAYKDRGLVVVGVHSPEFDFEGDVANVVAAVKRIGITYPVAIDNRLGTWNAWHNQFWPAEYLVDQNGRLIGHHYGEGDYGRMENAIRLLLGLNTLQDTSASDPGLPAAATSPEMHLGGPHPPNQANADEVGSGPRRYTRPLSLPRDSYALIGRWKVAEEYARTEGTGSELRLRFNAGKLHIVAGADTPITLDIVVDGKPQPPVTVQASRLYTLFHSSDYREHLLILRIPQSGLRVYSFTFG